MRGLFVQMSELLSSFKEMAVSIETRCDPAT